MYVNMYVCKYESNYACMHACMYVCVCMYVCKYVSNYVCMHACMYVCVCMYVYVCMCVCVYVCVYVCVCMYVCTKHLPTWLRPPARRHHRPRPNQWSAAFAGRYPERDFYGKCLGNSRISTTFRISRKYFRIFMEIEWGYNGFFWRGCASRNKWNIVSIYLSVCLPIYLPIYLSS